MCRTFAYIRPLAWYKLEIMTVKRSTFSSLLVAPVLLAASLAAMPAAWGTEPVHTDRNPALNVLHSLTDRASDLAIRAMAMVGIRYQYGGNTPEHGLDCSGLVRYVFKQAWDADLPRTSVEMSRVGEKVDSKDLQPGDLVFYNTLRRGFSHVGIYLGDNKFVHSPSAGSSIRIESMDLSYWKKRFNGARRINDPEQN
jgi:cell wall-associated NlpC family hydrolase